MNFSHPQLAINGGTGCHYLRDPSLDPLLDSRTFSRLILEIYFIMIQQKDGESPMHSSNKSTCGLETILCERVVWRIVKLLENHKRSCQDYGSNYSVVQAYLEEISMAWRFVKGIVQLNNLWSSCGPPYVLLFLFFPLLEYSPLYQPLSFLL